VRRPPRGAPPRVGDEDVAGPEMVEARFSLHCEAFRVGSNTGSAVRLMACSVAMLANDGTAIFGSQRQHLSRGQACRHRIVRYHAEGLLGQLIRGSFLRNGPVISAFCLKFVEYRR
jgi:hypothetical protein